MLSIAIKNFWCALFHRKSIYPVRIKGDWKLMECAKCNIRWTEPRGFE